MKFYQRAGSVMHDEVVKEWIQKAEDDYKAIIKLDPVDTPYVICFHCQQCIEKYLKALILAYGEVPPVTHNLIRLNSIAAKYESSLEEIFDLLEELNPYSVPARYPGIIVTEDNARMAIQITKEIRM